jgi:hypothetical protein
VVGEVVGELVVGEVVGDVVVGEPVGEVVGEPVGELVGDVVVGESVGAAVGEVVVGVCVGDSAIIRLQLTTTCPGTKMAVPLAPHPVFANAVGWIDVTDSGTVNVVIAVFANASSPMISSCEPAAKVTVTRLPQLTNVYEPNSVTAAGIAVIVMTPDPANTPNPMAASCEPASKVTVARLAHP